ncbi:MAG: xylulokinase [Planctomycetota bacterium]
MALFLGLDIGTSGTKAIVINEKGQVVTKATIEYAIPFSTPKPLWAEHDPAQWTDATVRAIKKVLSDKGVSAATIAAVGLTGQMHGLVALDSKNNVIRPCIMWNDQRTQAQCDALTASVGREHILKITGNPVLPGFTSPKILWMKDQEPDNYKRIAKILLPKDYIRWFLSGEYFSDVSDASGTGLLDVSARRWSDEMVRAVGLTMNALPTVEESPVVTTKVSSSAATITGLLAGTPIVGGGGDQAAQAVGAGIVREGLTSATLGTSGVVFAASDAYRVEPAGRLHAFCHAVPGKWHLMGVMLSAAGSFKWYKDALCAEETAAAAVAGDDVYDQLTRSASSIEPGSEGLFFLPYLSGERAPHPDPDARGAYIGLTLRHRKAHLSRATLEGITFGMNDILGLMREIGVVSTEIRASGGGANSAFWLKLLADIFNSRIATVNVSEGAAYGAAVLASVGAGAYKTVESAADAMVSVTTRLDPEPTTVKVYSSTYQRYRALYPLLKDWFRGEA